MYQKLRNALIITASIFTAESVYCSAIPLTLDATAGRRWVELDQDGIQTHEFNIAAMHPLRKFPAAVGLGFTITNFSDDDVATHKRLNSVDTSWGYDLTAEMKIWLPRSAARLPFIPHLKYSHDLYSEYDFKGSNDLYSEKVKLETSGYRINFGGIYRINTRLNALAEYSIGTQRVKSKSKMNGRNSFSGSSYRSNRKNSYDSKALLFGINMNV